MFWQTLITTFGILFLAELGDKTQLAVLCLASNKQVSHRAVFLGAVLALAVITFLAVFLGRIVGTYLPRQYVRKVAGAVFIVVGLLIFLGKFWLFRARIDRMHELSIASNLIEIVDKAIEGRGVSRVTSLRVVIGELSNVVPDCLAFAFEVASRGTVAENARLDFVHKPLVGRCLDCGKEFAIRDFLFRCPDCESPKIDVVSGKEFFLESIECE